MRRVLFVAAMLAAAAGPMALPPRSCSRARSSTAPRQARPTMAEKDFAGVNGDRRHLGMDRRTTLHSTGKPIGVLRSQRIYVNFELMVEWRHLESAGNSGAFVWVPKAALTGSGPASCRNGASRSRCSTTASPSSTSGSDGEEGRLVHHQRRRVRGRQVGAEAVSTDLAQRRRGASPAQSEQGRRRVEPLLRSRHRRSRSGSGSTARKCPAAAARSPAAAICASRPKARRSSSGTSASASCLSTGDSSQLAARNLRVASRGWHNELLRRQLEDGALGGELLAQRPTSMSCTALPSIAIFAATPAAWPRIMYCGSIRSVE